MLKIVVTGGAGFIGGNVIRMLSDIEDTQVVAIDDLSTGSIENLDGLRVQFLQGSILEEDLDELFDSAHSVIHLGARPSVPRSIKDPIKSHDANATGTLRVLEAARRTGAHVVVASSSSVYGANRALPKSEDMVCMPLSPYAVSKLATEAYALAYQHSYGMSTLALRFFNVYGPLQAAGHAYAAVIPSFVEAALRGEPLRIYGDGLQSRDFTYVETVASTLVSAALERVTSERPVNLALGTRSTLLDVVSVLETILDRRLQIQFLAPRVGDVRDSQADRSRLSELFPAVRATPLEDGVRATVRWMSSQVSANAG